MNDQTPSIADTERPDTPTRDEVEAKQLDRASLRGADLRRVDLTAVDGLRPSDLAGADLTDATLSPDFHFDALTQVEEISKNARKVFIGLLIACLYTWLTIATTTDVALVVNTPTSELPIIGTAIPIVGFYWGASLILAAVYIYFHLYLLRLWRALASLPAKFADGRALDDAAYPWLLTGMVRIHFEHLRAEARPLAGLETLVSVFLAWWVVPLTLLGLWLRFLPRHDWAGTTWLVLLITLTAAHGILTHRFKRTILHGERMPRPNDQPGLHRLPSVAWHDLRTLPLPKPALVLGAGLTVVSWSAFVDPPSHGWEPVIGEVGSEDWLVSRVRPATVLETGHWIPWLLDGVAWGSYAHVRETELSTKLEGWSEGSTAGVDPAVLRHRNLAFADAESAFLATADLRDANFREAVLRDANLQGVDAESADFKEADLRSANLQKAILTEANLQKADLGFASLQEADLRGANLQLADLRGARLQLADLKGANLQETILEDANLQEAILEDADLQGGCPRRRQSAGGPPRQRQPPEGRPRICQPSGGQFYRRRPPEDPPTICQATERRP